MFIWILLAVIVLVSAYVFWLRPTLREHPWFDPFYDWIEPIEANLWAKSRTIFAARLLTAASLLVSIHDIAGPALMGIDVNPFIPEAYQQYVPLAGVLIGLVFERLRKITASLPTDGEE